LFESIAQIIISEKLTDTETFNVTPQDSIFNFYSTIFNEGVYMT